MVYEHVGVLNTPESYKLMFGYQTRWFGKISKKGLNKCGNFQFFFVSVLHFRGVQVCFQMPFLSYGVLARLRNLDKLCAPLFEGLIALDGRLRMKAQGI